MLFGTSGIRGLYGTFVNERLAMRIANIFAEKDVVIARDTRNTGETLSFAAVSGVLGRGRNVINIGIASTPTLALATKMKKCRGIMITASHNPPEYNGLKLYENGKEISRKMEAGIEKEYLKMEKEPNEDRGNMKLSAWDKTGKSSGYEEAAEEHIKLILNAVNSSEISKRKPKVVVDCNGAGAVISPKALEAIGCEVIAINDSLLGFARPSEPNAENLKGLAAKVIEVKADLGIGHDGDADRAVVVDELGNVLPLDTQLAIMVEHELGKNKKRNPARNTKKPIVISTMEASLCVREVVEKNGGELLITPVGSLYVSEEMEAKKAIFGGEPCGEYIFSDGLNVPDGILTGAKFVEIFCEKGKLSELGTEYKSYPMVREKFKCEGKDKYNVVEEIRKEVQVKLDKTSKIRSEDGLRVDEPDGWFLIRASGTEPFVRLTMEYKDKTKLDKKAEELRGIIREKLE
ncbi:MAG: hypothetical protein WCT31_03930 [Candidatus Micrarchaeia archaeon]